MLVVLHIVVLVGVVEVVAMMMFCDHTQCIWGLVVVAVVVKVVEVVLVVFDVQQLPLDVEDHFVRSIPWVLDHTSVVDDAIANWLMVVVVDDVVVVVVDDWLENLLLWKELGLGLVLVVWEQQLFVLLVHTVLVDHGLTIYHMLIEWLETGESFLDSYQDEILKPHACMLFGCQWFEHQ